MQTNILCKKEWRKLDHTKQTVILKRLNQLTTFINSYESYNKIFNNENITHKKYQNNFFIVKSSNTFQVRLLCRYTKKGIEIHKIYIKNGTNSASPSTYIKEFDSYVYNYK